MGAPLRMGIVVDGLSGPRWVAAVIQAIRRGGDGQVAAVVVDDTLSQRTDPAPLLYRTYEKWDRKIFSSGDDPSANEDLQSLLDIGSKDVDSTNRPLDVVLDLREFPERPVSELKASHGTWRFHFGDDGRYGSEAPLFRELTEKDAVCTLSLAREPGIGMNGRVAYNHYAAADPTSLAQTAAELRWKAPTLATRLLAELAMHGRPHSASDVPLGGPRTQGYPGPVEMIRYLGRLSTVLAAAKIQYYLFREHWTVGIRTDPGVAGSPLDLRLADFVPLRAPAGRFFADPFPIWVEGVDYVFFEDYSHRDGRGGISYVKLDAEGRPGAPQPALQRDYHLSYPFIFSLDGRVYMVPETMQARRIELYRAVRFPDDWQLERVLIDDIAAVDATLLWHGGKIWLFATVEPGGGEGYDQLHVYHADDLAGPWTPHRANPVKTDVRSSRPAGGFFRSNGRLIRPSQDGSKGYGGAIHFSEVVRLSETEFEEKEIGRLEATSGSGVSGVHTINANDRVAVVDWKRLKPSALARRS